MGLMGFAVLFFNKWGSRHQWLIFRNSQPTHMLEFGSRMLCSSNMICGVYTDSYKWLSTPDTRHMNVPPQKRSLKLHSRLWCESSQMLRDDARNALQLVKIYPEVCTDEIEGGYQHGKKMLGSGAINLQSAFALGARVSL